MRLVFATIGAALLFWAGVVALFVALSQFSTCWNLMPG